MIVTFHDPRVDPEPAGWAAWRAATGHYANWEWPLLRAGAWHSRDPLLIAVLHRPSAGSTTPAVAAAPTGPAAVTAPAVAGSAIGEPIRPTANAAPAAPFAGVVAATIRRMVPRARYCPATGWPSAAWADVAAPQSSAQPGWWWDTDAPDERAAMFRAYATALRRKRHPAAILWRQVPAADRNLLPRPMLTRATAPVAVLDTPFAGRDAWLATLRKSRRTDLRRIARALDRDSDLAIKTGAAGDLVTAAELTRLARLNFDRHATAAADRRTGVRTHAWHAALLARDDVTAVAYRDGAGRLLGAGVVLDHPSRPLWLSWGAEPDGRKHLYFDLYGRIVDLATARGAGAVVLGKGMADLKADLGARLEPQYAVVSV